MFVALSSFILVVAGSPLIRYIGAVSNMIIINGAPYSSQLTFSDNMYSIDKDNTKQSEFRKPNENELYGVITCEHINLNAPLYYGDSESVLQRGAGQYTKSALPGEGYPILVGGHDASFFSVLKKVKVQDIVTLQTIDKKYEYQVTDIKVLDKNDSSAFDLKEKKEQLILYTCYPFGQLVGDRALRYYVYCELLQHKSDDGE